VYLAMIAHAQAPGRFLEIRWRWSRGMRRRFVTSTIAQSAMPMIAPLARETDVFVGVALRDGDRYGGVGAISRCGLLHVECDRPDGQERIGAFPLRPQLLVASGTSSHVHAYWRLAKPVDAATAQAANRALAVRLDGDIASSDAARILRPPSTLNHKSRTPRAVQVIAREPTAIQEFEVIAHELALIAPTERPRPATAAST
jgi:hypothetical protein